MKNTQITIVGKKDIVSYLKTHNDGNPYKTEELVRAEDLECNIPGEVFSAVADTYRTDVACRINTITKDAGKPVSSVTHIYNVLVRRSDGAVWRVNAMRAPLYFLEPLPIETAHGPMFADMEAVLSGLAVREPKRFRKAGEDTVQKWTEFCDKIHEKETQKYLEQEESARAFYNRAWRAFGNDIIVQQQTGPNVTKFSLDHGQLRLSYEEQDGKWYRTVNINPLAVPSDEDLFGKAPTWVDLGLPSGRLWAAENEAFNGKTHFPFDDALEAFGKELPPISAWQELINFCRAEWNAERHGYTLTGPNGNTLFLPAAGIEHARDRDLGPKYGYYWSSSSINCFKTRAVHFTERLIFPDVEDGLDKCFYLSVRLSKTPNN